MLTFENFHPNALCTLDDYWFFPTLNLCRLVFTPTLGFFFFLNELRKKIIDIKESKHVPTRLAPACITRPLSNPQLDIIKQIKKKEIQNFQSQRKTKSNLKKATKTENYKSRKLVSEIQAVTFISRVSYNCASLKTL